MAETTIAEARAAWKRGEAPPFPYCEWEGCILALLSDLDARLIDIEEVVSGGGNRASSAVGS